MSRGRRGGYKGRGARLKGPEVEWEDNLFSSQATRPRPLFPDIAIPTPKPFTQDEVERVDEFLSFRDACRNGPLFADLDPSQFTNERGKTNPRAGVDPFSDVARYNSKLESKSKTLPDFKAVTLDLRLFPQELWPIIDPLKKSPLWATVPQKPRPRRRKRKRPLEIDLDEQENNLETDHVLLDGDEIQDPEHDGGSDSDVPVTSSRRKKKARHSGDGVERESGQRRGLEAEDDIPDIEQDTDRDEDDDESDGEAQDSEYSEDSDEDNDYQAENYFSGGEEEDVDDGGGANAGDDVYD